ncbi:helicase associated domain-containing protein [Streptomyces avidinii]|uniref:helicase associated domain-containing protein n=1 Tax=Streptomyces avidinii TaxID=1895 RepID=UPI003795FD60
MRASRSLSGRGGVRGQREETHDSGPAPRHSTNVPRHPEREAALAAIDPDWNPGTLGWTVDWQRHYAYLTQLLAEGARLTAVVPGVPRHGEDIGRWLATQRRNWDRLNGVDAKKTGETVAWSPSTRAAGSWDGPPSRR